MISNHQLFGEFPDADVISAAIRLDDEQRLIPLHRQPQIGGGLFAEGQKLPKGKSEIRESRQLFVGRLVVARAGCVFWLGSVEMVTKSPTALHYPSGEMARL